MQCESYLTWEQVQNCLYGYPISLAAQYCAVFGASLCKLQAREEGGDGDISGAEFC